MPGRVTDVKCRRCRKILFTEESTPLLSGHGEELGVKQQVSGCHGTAEYCLYIASDSMPEWISELVQRELWTKGKIHCPGCDARIGSFNFVNPGKCDCGECVTPPVRLVHSKVDRLYNDKVTHSSSSSSAVDLNLRRIFPVPQRQSPPLFHSNSSPPH